MVREKNQRNTAGPNYLTILETQNPSIDIFFAAQNAASRISSSALLLQKGMSGKGITTDKSQANLETSLIHLALVCRRTLFRLS